MASSYSSVGHRFGPPPPPRLPTCHPGSGLLMRHGSHPYHHADSAHDGGMAISSTPNDGDTAQGPSGDAASFDMTGTVRPYTQDYRPSSTQQQSQPVFQPPHLHHPQRAQPSPTSSTAASGAPKPIRRRMRMITSCLECRRRKLKCNKSQPCTNCLKFSRDCLYLGPKLDEASQLRLTEIKEKVGSLERQLERDVAKSGSGGSRNGAREVYQQRILANEIEGEFDEERDLEITPMVALDLTYDDDADGQDDIMDLGVQVGRMRLTEKIGGLNRPRISEEIHAGLSGGAPDLGNFPPGLSSPSFGSGQSNRPGPFSESTGSDHSLPDFLRPSASYIPPTSGVFFGQVIQSPPLLTFLPAKPAGDRLLEHYFDAVHPIARCVHRPSFEAQYESFWEEVTLGYEPRTSVQAVVFAAWFSAAVAMDESVINREFGFTKANLVENMKIGTEVALSKANFLRTTRFDTMQAFVMYMIPLCRDEVSRAHSVLVGAASRMAECMGLNRDGKNYNLNPLETHVRRLVWHQLCFLDIRTCEAQGPKPAIRREDYDTRLPVNREEDQLLSGASNMDAPSTTHGDFLNQHSQASPEEGSGCTWTSTLFPLIRFEINEMMRIMWADRRKLEARKITLTQALTKIESFRKRMLASYDALLDERIPIQRYAKLVMHLLLYRLHVMVLHPFYANTATAMPARLRSVLVMSGVMIIELAMQLDADPALAAWKWYAGAYQQYQAALILATEVYYHPQHTEAARVWACLDYVFGLDARAPTEEKGRLVLVEIMSKMGAYMSMRKMRAPVLTAGAFPAKQAVKMEDKGSGGGAEARPAATHQQQQTYPQLRKTCPPGMKEEPGLVSPPPTGPMRETRYGPPRSDSSSSLSPQQHHNIHTGAGTGPSLVAHPRSQHSTPSGPSVVMANYGESLWGIPPPPLNPESPENSSSDGGSVVGGPGEGGMGPSMIVGGAHGMQGEWSHFQEDAINALFPFDPQTGSFAGFGDPLTSGGGMGQNGWGAAQQGQGRMA